MLQPQHAIPHVPPQRSLVNNAADSVFVAPVDAASREYIVGSLARSALSKRTGSKTSASAQSAALRERMLWQVSVGNEDVVMQQAADRETERAKHCIQVERRLARAAERMTR